MIFADKLIQLRKQHGMSQEQLADRLGITRQSVSKWESGGTVPELSKLITLSEMFDVSIDYLVKENVEQSKHEPDRSYDYQEESKRLEEKVDTLTSYMRGYQFTSKTRIKGIPLVSIRLSRHLGKDAVAKGIIAIGNVAIGVVSLGCLSIGVISIGALALGVLALGAIAFGIAAVGAMAVGIVAIGSLALGIYAGGVAAVGKEIAVGVAAIGDTAIGETAKGNHCMEWNAQIPEQEIRNFILRYHPKLWEPLLDILTKISLVIK